MDLRVYPKNKKFVVQDMENNRKQIGKPYQSKSAANAACRKLITDVATDKVVINGRYKFKEEYKKYAKAKLESAEKPDVRLSIEGVRAYESLYRNYIADCFPDIYLDEIRGKTLHDFIICCYQKKQATYKTAKNIISHIKTFLRDCLGEGLISRCSVLHWKMSKQYDLQPVDDDLYYKTETTPIMPDEAKRLMDNLWNNRNKDFYSAYKLAAIATLAFTGLRFSELKGIKKDVIDLDNKSIFIAGVYNHREGLWKNKTKVQASKRSIEIIDELMIVLTFWLNVIKDMRNPYLFPSTRGTGPLSEFRFRKLIWKTYEENGLAKLEWTTKEYKNKYSRGRTENFRIIESPFKGCPTKTFRHSLATHLVNAVKSDPALDTNYVRSVLGHGDFNTTQGIYGKHIMRVTEEERAARRAAVSKATKAHRLIQK
jgi:integrase|tara:strand:+ start:517 stop:1797 length:1281 start_codon:yes stop_codon:yes gene_type:complete